MLTLKTPERCHLDLQPRGKHFCLTAINVAEHSRVDVILSAAQLQQLKDYLNTVEFST